MKVINTYFKTLTEKQNKQFEQLEALYNFWNEQINVISRQDISNLYTHHVLHSLAIAKAIQFKPNTDVIDIGTGGGFPGIPLAIIFPEVNFLLTDPVKKKIKVVRNIVEELKLTNIVCDTVRNYQIKKKFDFVVSRAVSRFPKFVELAEINFKNEKDGVKNDVEKGIFYLKGGDFADEIQDFKEDLTIFTINDYFKEEFFETKKIIYMPLAAIRKSVVVNQ